MRKPNWKYLGLGGLFGIVFMLGYFSPSKEHPNPNKEDSLRIELESNSIEDSIQKRWLRFYVYELDSILLVLDVEDEINGVMEESLHEKEFELDSMKLRLKGWELNH